ncbi:MAG: GWxTD domain-containing protein [Candidatus Aminicenantales bacterium]
MTEKKQNRFRIPLIALALAFALALPGFVSAQDKIKEKDLPQRHQDWLKLVNTFILPAEKDVFLTLPTELDRDYFINAFWKQRDPTPETPVNEYKEEMEKRFAYVKKYFHRGTVREGWMTDQGRIYMILGPPVSIENFEGVRWLNPAVIWHYYGDPAKKLPSFFQLIFFQREGAGEWKLYSPVSDGPASLLIDTRELDLTDGEKIYEKMMEVAPTLAQPSLSIIPGQYPLGFQPSPQNTIILADIYESPKKDINPSYATHFLNYRGVVSTEYLTNYIESDSSLSVLRDGDRGLNFLYFAISPRTVSIDYFKPRDQYYCNFKLSVSLRRGDEIVFQYNRDYPFYFPPDRVEHIQANGIAIQDMFPVAEGSFKLNVLLQNTVGKEFSLLEKDINVPAADGPTKITDPIVGYGFADSPGTAAVPFKFLGRQLQTDPKGMFGSGDGLAFAFGLIRLPREIWAEGTVAVEAAGSRAEGKSVTLRKIKLSDLPYAEAMTITDAVPAPGLSPDYYELHFILKSGAGETLDNAFIPVILSPDKAVPHAVTLNKALPAENAFLYYYGLAMQYDKTGAPDKAEASFRKGYDLKPDFPEGAAQFANFLIRIGKIDQALAVIEPLASSANFRFDYLLVKGTALKELARYDEAIDNLLDANKIYNSDTRVLNALGFCFYKKGMKAEALNALNASLRLDPEQKETKDILDRVEKELK